MSCGNPGHFHDAPLKLLLKHLLLYLATPPHKKDADFWRVFNPEWDEQYLSPNSEELEPMSEEKAYEDEKETARQQNKQELKKRGRKAKLLHLPLSGTQLCELYTRSADSKVRKHNSLIGV